MLDSKAILKRLDRIDDLPTLPSIVMEMERMLRDPNTPIEKLTRVIEKDQAMVPKLLKLVNSSFFGLQSNVSEVSRAIALLGFNTVRNAIISISVVEVFKVKAKIKDFDIRDFWMHSVSVGVISKYLSQKRLFKAPEVSFTGGLLHDIGKVVLALYFGDLFSLVWVSAEENQLSFYDAEEKEIHITHAQIGAYLAKKWNLPAELWAAIQGHHHVTKDSDAFDLLSTIHTADFIVNSHRDDSKKKITLSSLCPDVENAMEPHLKTLPEWFPGVSQDIQSACGFFIDR